jgi:NADPH:quinone reductase-like Zn-dependent oxidoreductase
VAIVTEIKTMKAITQKVYGTPEVLELSDVAMPALEDHQILIEVYASSVNAAEWHITTGLPYLVRPSMGFARPKKPTPGSDVAGVVAAVGKDVVEYTPGDRVFGEIADGTWAQYARGTEKTLAHLPEGVSYEQAGAIGIAGLTALQGLVDHGGVKPDNRVLIIGASGGVGTYAVQIAKALGAHVTAVCSTRNVVQTKDLGADRVVDYTEESYFDGDGRYDVILDIVGSGPILKTKKLLASGGRYVFISGPKRKIVGPVVKMIRAKTAFLFSDREMKFFVAASNHKDLVTLGEMLANGQIRSVIEGRYELKDAALALAYLGEGHSRGKNIILAR